MTRPVVFQLPVGPNTSTEWQSSAASNRPEHARGTAQDDPARLGVAHGQQPQLPACRPGGGMLGRPFVAGSVTGRPARQMPQDCGGPARQAADQPGEGGVHAGRAGQRPAHLGRPGQGRVAPMLGQVPRTWATSAGETSSQVCPKARPAACPVAHTSTPAPTVAPSPTARSWSPGLVNGGASGGRCPPGGRGGQASCHIRATPR